MKNPGLPAGSGRRSNIRIGTAGWSYPSGKGTWKGLFYPKKRGDELPFYAEHFDTVEVNSTYYRLPDEDLVAKWAERIPDDFVMHVKAFGMMTRHPVKVDVLPPDLAEGAPVDDKGRVDRPSRELRAEVFARFYAALEPLRSSGKLGGVLLQFPSYIVCKPYSFEYLEWAKEQLRGDHMLVEFRHRSWLDEDNRANVLAFLEELGATHVIVDAPKTDAKNLVPTVLARTSQTVYVRMHGRNAKTWNIRGRSAAERFDYLYSEEELRQWVEPVKKLSEGAEQAYVMFNNNGRTASSDRDGKGWISQAPTNALQLRRILGEEGVPL
jgi:uncharacterized protein YecE (DUF72 family)